MITLAVIVGLSLLILIHEFGHFIAAKFFNLKVEEFGFGFPPKVFSIEGKETEYSFNLLPLGGFVKIYGEDVESLDEIEEPDKSLAFQPVWKKSIIMLAGIVMNIILGWLAISFVFMSGVPQHLSISRVADDSPASRSGLRTGDLIVKAEGPGKTLEDPISADQFTEMIKQNPTAEYTLHIKRGDEVVRKNIEPRKNPPEGEGNIGIALANIGVEERGFFESFIDGFRSTAQTLAMIVVAFTSLIGKAFTAPDAATQNLAGPVGIFVLAKEAGELGLVYLTQLVGIISLNLAVLNLIPFPALDGGRFIMSLIEKAKGSPISRKVQAGINLVGFAILILLVILITFKDISKFL